MADPKQERAVRQLLANFETYDQHVDVVSAFEWVFTDPQVKEMPATVRHFERFPRVRAANGSELTPDFTVLFNDGNAIIGEIAKIALVEESVDALCLQIGKYSTVVAVPDGTGNSPKPVHIDVMYVVPMKTGMAAYQRIITERYEQADHPFKPEEPPCIIQFSRDESAYTFQRLPAQSNGTLAAGEREPHIQKYLDNGFSPPVSDFIKVKVARPYINDPIDPLYLATQFWTRTWPDRHGASQDDIVVNVSETGEYLRQRYGYVRARDVRRALELLDAVGLAARGDDGNWTVSRMMLGRRGERDIHRNIAGRLLGKPRRVVSRPPRRDDSPRQGTLFDA